MVDPVVNVSRDVERGYGKVTRRTREEEEAGGGGEEEEEAHRIA
jgi:hypothetical protein